MFVNNCIILEEGESIEANHCVCEFLPSIKILVLTHFEEDRGLLSAIKVGARGMYPRTLLLMTLSKRELSLPTDGSLYLPQWQQIGLRNSVRWRRLRRKSSQTTKWTWVRQLIARGATNTEIVNALFIAENIVKGNLRNLMGKTARIYPAASHHLGTKKGVRARAHEGTKW